MPLSVASTTTAIWVKDATKVVALVSTTTERNVVRFHGL